jgi:ATP-binding cassette subfamily B protein
MRYLLRLIPYTRPYRWQVVLGWILVISSSAFVMAQAPLVRWAIDTGLRVVREGEAITGLNGSTNVLVLAAVGLVAAAVLRGVAQFGQTFIGESLGQRIAYDIRNDIYDHMQRLSYAYHDQMETGQIMSRSTQDVENIRMFVAQALFRTVYIVLLIVVGLGLMFTMNITLALVSMLTMPIIVWRSVVFQRRIRSLWTQIQQSQGELTQIAEEGLTGIRVVKAFSREPFESKKFRTAAEEQAELNLKAVAENAKVNPMLQGLGMAQMGLTAGVGALLVARGGLSEGELTAFLTVLNLLQLPLRTIAMMVNAVSRCVSSAERVFELLDAQSAVKDAPNARPLTGVQGRVRFEHVSFGYNAASQVLTDVDIDAKPGSVIALLGPAGSGKSTVVNLLPRFYDVTGGAITIDGTDIRDVTVESLRANIGIVQQDVFLFIGTIRDNIAYGRPSATQEEIERAAKAARIHDFIVSLPDGYDEWVGERGVTLSGGQKQRVAIARTLLLDPRILIFDDSTASVDSQTEFLILQALNELMHGRTTFVIAQRLRTVMRADEIVVLDRGRVVQRGSHAELLQQEGLYRTIFDLELKDQEEALGEIVASRQAAAPAIAGGSQ